MRECNLSGALFYRALLNFTDFYKAKLIGAKLNNCILNLPEPIAGGMCESINFAVLKGVTLSGADITAIDYLGDADVIAQTFGTKDTKLHWSIEEKMLEPNDHSLAANSFWRAQSGEALSDQDQERLGSGFITRT